MRISYNINSFAEFKKLPLICKCTLIISYMAVVMAILYIPLKIHLNTEFLNEHNLFLYGFVTFIVCFIITIIFDRDRKKHVKVGVLKRRGL